MNKKEAIEYLERKGKLSELKRTLTKKDEEIIDKVMKEGKIFGDPIVEVNFN